ncbi:hypothetical protein GCM10027429_06220 [Marivirga atlantica]
MPSIAFLEMPMVSNKVGSNKGKLSIAIKVVLLLARETMPETKVSTPAKPIDDNMIVVIKYK